MTCRSCRTPKYPGDICAGCGAGAPKHTLRPTIKPISVTKEHGFHEPISRRIFAS